MSWVGQTRTPIVGVVTADRQSADRWRPAGDAAVQAMFTCTVSSERPVVTRCSTVFDRNDDARCGLYQCSWSSAEVSPLRCPLLFVDMYALPVYSKVQWCDLLVIDVCHRPWLAGVSQGQWHTSAGVAEPAHTNRRKRLETFFDDIIANQMLQAAGGSPSMQVLVRCNTQEQARILKDVFSFSFRMRAPHDGVAAAPVSTWKWTWVVSTDYGALWATALPRLCAAAAYLPPQQLRAALPSNDALRLGVIATHSAHHLFVVRVLSGRLRAVSVPFDVKLERRRAKGFPRPALDGGAARWTGVRWRSLQAVAGINHNTSASSKTFIGVITRCCEVRSAVESNEQDSEVVFDAGAVVVVQIVYVEPASVDIRSGDTLGSLVELDNSGSEATCTPCGPRPLVGATLTTDAAPELSVALGDDVWLQLHGAPSSTCMRVCDISTDEYHGQRTLLLVRGTPVFLPPSTGDRNVAILGINVGGAATTSTTLRYYVCMVSSLMYADTLCCALMRCLREPDPGNGLRHLRAALAVAESVVAIGGSSGSSTLTDALLFDRVPVRCVMRDVPCMELCTPADHEVSENRTLWRLCALEVLGCFPTWLQAAEVQESTLIAARSVFEQLFRCVLTELSKTTVPSGAVQQRTVDIRTKIFHIFVERLAYTSLTWWFMASRDFAEELVWWLPTVFVDSAAEVVLVALTHASFDVSPADTFGARRAARRMLVAVSKRLKPGVYAVRSSWRSVPVKHSEAEEHRIVRHFDRSFAAFVCRQMLEKGVPQSLIVRVLSASAAEQMQYPQLQHSQLAAKSWSALLSTSRAPAASVKRYQRLHDCVESCMLCCVSSSRQALSAPFVEWFTHLLMSSLPFRSSAASLFETASRVAGFLTGD